MNMGMTVDQVIEAGLTLPDDQRLEVAEALVTSIGSNREPILDDGLLAEVRRRSAELDAGTVTPIPWSVVKQRNRPDGASNG
jgi:putative addiction module component (TIGR02574 family)